LDHAVLQSVASAWFRVSMLPCVKMILDVGETRMQPKGWRPLERARRAILQVSRRYWICFSRDGGFGRSGNSEGDIFLFVASRLRIFARSSQLIRAAAPRIKRRGTNDFNVLITFYVTIGAMASLIAIAKGRSTGEYTHLLRTLQRRRTLNLLKWSSWLRYFQCSSPSCLRSPPGPIHQFDWTNGQFGPLFH
jgi:hypothetical protein